LGDTLSHEPGEVPVTKTHFSLAFSLASSEVESPEPTSPTNVKEAQHNAGWTVGVHKFPGGIEGN